MEKAVGPWAPYRKKQLLSYTSINENKKFVIKTYGKPDMVIPR